MAEPSGVLVVGAGLAGCEAALQCARRGIPARLFEMRPFKTTEAHRTGDVAEIVCSNSFKSDEPENAHGLLKAELRLFGAVLLECAERARVPGGKALVVDRARFSAGVQAELDRAGVEVVREEVTDISSASSDDSAPTVIATGPLTSQPMVASLAALLGCDRLFFFDAIAPIVSADSVDTSAAFAASRYGAGADYLNCPMNEDEYNRFIAALLSAELRPAEPRFFEACLPIEELARRGRMAPAFGPMKPVGLIDPRTGARPFAITQLRRENVEGTMYNLVGFQTRLKHGEQARVFRMIPGLEKAEFLRFGSMHRNTYLDSPKVLLPTLQTRPRPDVLIAGQLTGVEGYVESIGAGLVAGINAARLARGLAPVLLPRETMLGSLLCHVSGGDSGPERENSLDPVFQPMNANFGLLPPMADKTRGREKKRLLAARSLAAAIVFRPLIVP